MLVPPCMRDTSKCATAEPPSHVQSTIWCKDTLVWIYSPHTWGRRVQYTRMVFTEALTKRKRNGFVCVKKRGWAPLKVIRGHVRAEQVKGSWPGYYILRKATTTHLDVLMNRKSQESKVGIHKTRTHLPLCWKLERSRHPNCLPPFAVRSRWLVLAKIILVMSVLSLAFLSNWSK